MRCLHICKQFIKLIHISKQHRSQYGDGSINTVKWLGY